jgi:hypothetical protein
MSPVIVELEIFDKRLEYLATAADLVYLTSVQVWLKHDTGEFQLAADDPTNQVLQAPGCRYVLAHKGDITSGRIIRPQFPLGPFGEVTYQLVGDYSVFEDTLAYVNPLAPLTPTALGQIAQAWQTGTAVPDTIEGQSGYYLWPADITTAEDAVLDIVEKNLLTRLGRPVKMTTSRGRGGNARAAGILPDVRFTSVAEAVQPLLDWSGLGLYARQVDDLIEVGVWEPAVYGQELDIETGTLASGNGTVGYPDATRTVVMGPGEGPARAYELVVDAALEAEYGYIIEVTKDATGGDLDWPDEIPDEQKLPVRYALDPRIAADARTKFLSYLRGEGAEKLADGAPTNALSIELAENETFTFGGPTGYHVGDQVIVTSHGIDFDDRITSVTLSVTSEGKSTITPTLGEEPPAGTDSDLFQVYVAIEQLAGIQRGTAARR